MKKIYIYFILLISSLFTIYFYFITFQGNNIQKNNSSYSSYPSKFSLDEDMVLYESCIQELIKFENFDCNIHNYLGCSKKLVPRGTKVYILEKIDSLKIYKVAAFLLRKKASNSISIWYEGYMYAYSLSDSIPPLYEYSSMPVGGKDRKVTNYQKINPSLIELKKQGYDFTDTLALYNYCSKFFNRKDCSIFELEDKKGQIHLVDGRTKEYGILDSTGTIQYFTKINIQSGRTNLSNFLENEVQKVGFKED